MPGPYPLATEACTIDAFGISSPTFEDILASKTARYQQVYGADVYLGADSQDGEFLAIQALAQYDTNQAQIAAYLAYSPATATGAGLASVVKINGIRKREASNSSADLTLVGQAGTRIISGLVEDGFGNQWALPSVVVIPLSGEVITTAVCQVPGAITASANTIDQIVNVQRGWQSATNLAGATPGAPVEQDAALRRRQGLSTALAAVGPLEAIEGAVANVAGVQRSRIYRNDTDAPDTNGIPWHSIAAVVEGGDAMTIAETIASKKAPGDGTFGTLREVVFDEQGVPDTILFFPLSITQIWCSITIQPFSGYVETTGTLVVAAVSAALNSLGIGAGVYLSRLWAPAGLVGEAATQSSGLTQTQLDALASTFVVKDIQIGTSQVVSPSDIPIAFYQAASSVTSSISVILAS